MNAYNEVWPLAGEALTQDLMELLHQAIQYGQLKKGANEVQKSIVRDTCALVVMAADTDPFEIVNHLPLRCEEKNVPYVFIPSQRVLGRACGISGHIVAACVIYDRANPNSELIPTVQRLAEEVERINI